MAVVNLDFYSYELAMNTQATVLLLSLIHIFYVKATELGGQVSGEHGIGHGKVPYLAESVGEVNMRLMEQIKQVFDPNLILNPGKVCYKL